MQAQKYSDFKSFIEDAVPSVLGAAPEMDVVEAAVRGKDQFAGFHRRGDAVRLFD